ncbi:putative fatty acyl-CoA reductase CG8306 [Bombus pyrosoma]|uniref:putative fatty acyl-CoA reductase CG8306 n=1 Tax=Bombus pyrosoma TaxID=396416 RepID=UPI001CB8CD08|nr:putative fatty acyl-CoA reductase CG8306 [Bombus pyrosoma]
MDTINKETNENGTNEGLNKTNSLEEFYAGSRILVTGATGFVGVGLLEKLMRVCPRVAAIFILIRPKSNETIEQRFEKIIDDPIYDNIKAKHPSVLSKVYPVEGDVSLPHLGLSREDRNLLLEKVNIVFHVATTVRFDEPLHVAVNVNTKDTARVIELWNDLRHRISFVHVGTAYSNANLHEIGEKVYTTCLKPSEVIDMCDKLDKTTINQKSNHGRRDPPHRLNAVDWIFTPTGVCRHPNSYILCRYLLIVGLFLGLFLDIVAAFDTIASSCSA